MSSSPPKSRSLLWVIPALVVAAALFTWLGARFFWSDLVARHPVDAELPDYGAVADFTLTDQTGAPFGKANLDGNPWVADFIFTRCSGPCPLLSLAMSRLADSLQTDPRIRFVSFSVDPERDTPEVLTEYGKNYGVRASQWHFLTGERRIISDLAIDTFHLAMGDPVPVTAADLAGDTGDAAKPGDADDASRAAAAPDGQPEFYDIPHSLRFILVDAAGRIRGYYDGTDGAARARLGNDLSRLLPTAS